MKITDIDINEWQRLLNQFKASGANTTPNKPAAMRCENTQLSIARFAGGCTAYGERYMFFAPPRNCDRFGGDIDKLREACARERGINPEEDFPEVFAEWLLALTE